MTNKLTTLARSAALTMALAIPAAGFASSAFADDEYGTNRSPSILSSAQSAAYANPADTPLARATAQAKAAASQVATTARTAPVVAPVASNDLVGQGGQQDNLAREIYTPGYGTDW